MKCARAYRNGQTPYETSYSLPRKKLVPPRELFVKSKKLLLQSLESTELAEVLYVFGIAMKQAAEDTQASGHSGVLEVYRVLEFQGAFGVGFRI